MPRPPTADPPRSPPDTARYTWGHAQVFAQTDHMGNNHEEKEEKEQENEED